ncbi:MAG: transglutaminaseTgpA domain-containing protein, partial [Verrucomicrobia bacterium]|nr:transglutaminaseTgpA domain-containing protein [Verrucomicrobiota bacterium]
MSADAQTDAKTSGWRSRWQRFRRSSVRVRFNFHTLSLLGITAAMGYAGTVQNNGAAYLLCFLTGTIAAMSWLRARENLRGLEVLAGRLEAQKAGVQGKLVLEIHATGAQTIWGVEVLCAGSGKWGFIEQVASGEKVRVSVALPAAQIGVEQSIRVRLRSGYPLGLFSAERDVVIDHVRKIHPQAEGHLPLPGADPALSGTMLESGQSAGQPGREGDDFAGMREWQPGDSLRHVDWRAVARGRPLLVKQWASGSGAAVTLDWSKLDLDTAARAAQIARWIEECEATSTPYALRLPETEIPVGLGPAQVQKCLDALAEMAGADQAEAHEAKRVKRLPTGHEHSTFMPQGLLLALCGMLALVAVPILDFTPAAVLFLLVACIFGRLMFKKAFGTWVPLIVLIGGVVMVHLMHSGGLFTMEGGIAALVVLLGAKLLESHTPHDFQVLTMMGWFLCLCGLLSEQTLSRSLWTLTVFFGTTVCMVRFRRGRLDFMPPLKLTGTMFLQAMPVAVLLFLVFPRGSFEALTEFGTQRTRMTGVSEDMEPGQVSKLAESEEPAFRAEFPDTREPPPNLQRYWRCVVLWDGNGLSWKRGPSWERERRERLPRAGDLRQIITMEPHGRLWLPSLDVPVEAQVDGRKILPDMSDLLYVTEPVNNLKRVEVVSRVTQDSIELRPIQRLMALRVPKNLSAKVNDLAQKFKASGKTDLQIAQAAVGYFQAEGFQYTLDPGKYEGPGALDEFLFERKVGFCEHFSAAYATLMRAAGIPARVVIGYMGGEWSSRGGYMIVRQSDAHAWTELWLKGSGWTRVDLTAALAPGRMNLDLRTLLAGDEELERQRNSFFWRGSQELRLWWDGVEYDWYNTVISFDEEAQIAWLTWLGL